MKRWQSLLDDYSYKSQLATPKKGKPMVRKPSPPKLQLASNVACGFPPSLAI